MGGEDEVHKVGAEGRGVEEGVGLQRRELRARFENPETVLCQREGCGSLGREEILGRKERRLGRG